MRLFVQFDGRVFAGMKRFAGQSRFDETRQIDDFAVGRITVLRAFNGDFQQRDIGRILPCRWAAARIKARLRGMTDTQHEQWLTATSDQVTMDMYPSGEHRDDAATAAS